MHKVHDYAFYCTHLRCYQTQWLSPCASCVQQTIHGSNDPQVPVFGLFATQEISLTKTPFERLNYAWDGGTKDRTCFVIRDKNFSYRLHIFPKFCLKA